MYTTKTPIDKCRFNVTQLQFFFFFCIFCKRQISVNLFYFYQRLQCTDIYFFKIKFGLFLYLPLSASWKENDMSWYISVIRQTVGYWTPVYTQPFSWRLHITITYNLPHLRQWYVNWRCHSNSVNTGSSLPKNSDVMTRKKTERDRIDMIRNKFGHYSEVDYISCISSCYLLPFFHKYHVTVRSQISRYCSITNITLLFDHFPCHCPTTLF
jgi:hypothetical protein